MPGLLESRRRATKGAGEEIRIPSAEAEIPRVVRRIVRLLRSRASCRRGLRGVELAVVEALTNAIGHGNGGDVRKEVRLAYRVHDDEFLIDIADEGTGFQPDQVPDPTQRPQLGRPGGRGIQLMRHFMDSVEYLGTGNRVVMRKRLAAPGRRRPKRPRRNEVLNSRGTDCQSVPR
jgi:serine/threonine-protein kinase RsbW